MFRLARSNVAATQNFSGTVQLGDFGSAGGHAPGTGYWAHQVAWLGLSVPDNAPSGWYFGRMRLTGTYSMPAGAQTLSFNQPFKYEVRPWDWQGARPIQSGPEKWVEKSKHVAFRGNRGFTVYEPYRHKDDVGSENPPFVAAQVISTVQNHMVDQSRGGAQAGVRRDEPFMWLRGDR